MFDRPTIEPTEEGKPRSITELKWSEALVDPVKTEEILEAIESAMSIMFLTSVVHPRT